MSLRSVKFGNFVLVVDNKITSQTSEEPHFYETPKFKGVPFQTLSSFDEKSKTLVKSELQFLSEQDIEMVGENFDNELTVVVKEF